MKNWRIEAIILAVGLSLAGVFVRNGLSEFSSRSRVVTVKGLAEMEVKADKVTWPLTYKVLGNDMVSLYNEIEESNAKIIAFLKSKGVKENEISVNAPEIIDTKAERYNTTVQPYRYNVTTVVTVTSKQVDLVRGQRTKRTAQTRSSHRFRGLPLQRDIRLHEPQRYQTEDDRGGHQKCTYGCRKVCQRLGKQFGKHTTRLPRTVLHREPRSEHTLYQTGTCRNNDRLLARGLTRELRQRNILPRSYVLAKRAERHTTSGGIFQTEEQKNRRVYFHEYRFLLQLPEDSQSGNGFQQTKYISRAVRKTDGPVSFQEIPVAETP